MSAPAASERLAPPLHRLARRVHTAVEPSALAESAVALRAFVARPSAAGYLTAVRTLRAAVTRQKLNRLAAVAAPRLAGEHLAGIAASVGLPAELKQLLSLLPPDARTTRRFAVISQMLIAHELLSAHAETAVQDLQEHHGPPDPRLLPVDRRRVRR